MKLFKFFTLLLLLSGPLSAQDMVRIVRWVSPITGDFETLREDFNPDNQLQGWGYKNKLYQFSAYKTRPNDPNATAVNRWVMPNCAASIVIAEHEIPEATLLSWGYKSKQFLFYAYRTKPASGDFVAVNRWINAKPQGDKCRDFTLTIAETELTDAQLISYGYSGKVTQFWVPRPGMTIARPSSFTASLGTSNTISRSKNNTPEKRGELNSVERDGMACTSQRVSFTESNFERIISGGIWNKIYPGVVYNALSVADGNFQVVNLPRRPMRLAIDLNSAMAGQVGMTVGQQTPAIIDRSTVYQSIVSLQQQNRLVSVAARAVFDVKQIFSQQQLNIAVGGSFEGWGANVQASFNTQSSQNKNVYLARLTQNFFTVSVDEDQELTTTPVLDDNTVYVASVTYGRIGYLRIESNETREKIEGALNARYSWTTGNASVSATASQEKLLRESQMVGFVVGGSPVVVTTMEQFLSYVQDSRWNPSVVPVPISYSCKFLRDKADAYVATPLSYDERICKPITRGNTLRIILTSGSDDLRGYNTAFVKLNYTTGGSSPEFLLQRGLGQNQSITKDIQLPTEIDLVTVRSITFRHDGTPNNNPFNGGDAGHTYDNWDLQSVSIGLLTADQGLVNVFNSATYEPPATGSGRSATVPYRFSGDNRTITLSKQE